jgi:putative ABC transport system permease protein
VLVVGALLFVRSLRNLATLDAGFRQDGILIASVGFGHLNLPAARIPAFRDELVEKIRAIPGVESAADTNQVPVSGSSSGDTIWMDGEDSAKGQDVLLAAVGPGYFKTMGTAFLAGRDFDAHDVAGGAKTAIVNETFARQVAGGANPVGRRFRIEATPNDPETAYEIVGVTRNSKYLELREEASPVAFLALPQDTHPSPRDVLVLHSSGNVEGLVASVRQAFREIHPDLRYSFQVFKTQIQDSLLLERLMATLSGFFGVLAGMLAAIGLYGVISYTVARRTNEIGIRMALGAARGDVLAMILREVAGFTAVGLVAGVVLAIAGGKAVAALLFGLRPYDPATLAVAVAALIAVALGASYWPARRAARLDPMVALREE